MSEPSQTIHRFQSAKWVFIGWFLFYALTNSGHDISEGTLAFEIAKSWARTGTLGLESEAQTWGHLTNPGINGRYYSAHEIANTLLYLPLAAIWNWVEHLLASKVPPKDLDSFGRFVASFVPVTLCSLGLAWLYLFGIENFGLSPPKALLGTFGLGLTTFFWAYSQSSNDVVLAAVLIMLSVGSLIRYAHVNQPRFLVGAALAIGSALLTRISCVVLLPGLLIYLAMVRTRTWPQKAKSIMAFLAMLVPFAIVQMGYNYLRTGNPVFGPVHDVRYAANNSLDGNLVQGLTGLLFSPGRSIVLYAPLTLVSILVFRQFLARHRREALLVLLLVAPWFLLHAKLSGWHGSGGFGPRFLLSITPVLLIPWLASLGQPIGGKSIRGVTVICFLWGVFFGMCATISSVHYRQGLLYERVDLKKDYFWKLQDTQTYDTVVSAGRILRRIVMGGPMEIWEPASELHRYMGNTIDIWLVMAWRMGLPGIWAWILGIGLFVGACCAWTRALRLGHGGSPRNMPMV